MQVRAYYFRVQIARTERSGDGFHNKDWKTPYGKRPYQLYLSLLKEIIDNIPIKNKYLQRNCFPDNNLSTKNLIFGIINQKLTWNSHINKNFSKATEKSGNARIFRKILDLKQKMLSNPRSYIFFWPGVIFYKNHVRISEAMATCTTTALEM